jgi:ribosomal protein L37AE/L43A
MDAYITVHDNDIESENKLYVCKRCKFETQHPSILKRHLQKKFACKPDDETCNIQRDELIRELDDEKKEKQQFPCRVCGKGMANRHSRSIHEKSHLKKAMTGQEFLMNKIAQELMKTLKSNNTQTNIINNHVTINNIQINAFTKEDKSHVLEDRQFLNRCIARTNKGLVELVDRIHFNPTKPENKNFILANEKTSYIQYFDGNTWKYEQKQKFIKDVIDQSFDIMRDHFDEYEQEILRNRSIPMCHHIRNWMSKMSEKEIAVVKPLIKDLYTFIINQNSP